MLSLQRECPHVHILHKTTSWTEGSGRGWFGRAHFRSIRTGIVKTSARITCLFFSVQKVWAKRNGEVLLFRFHMFWSNMFCLTFYNIVFINHSRSNKWFRLNRWLRVLKISKQKTQKYLNRVYRTCFCPQEWWVYLVIGIGCLALVILLLTLLITALRARRYTYQTFLIQNNTIFPNVFIFCLVSYGFLNFDF